MAGGFYFPRCSKRQPRSLSTTRSSWILFPKVLEKTTPEFEYNKKFVAPAPPADGLPLLVSIGIAFAPENHKRGCTWVCSRRLYIRQFCMPYDRMDGRIRPSIYGNIRVTQPVIRYTLSTYDVADGTVTVTVLRTRTFPSYGRR
jgi:hypothetical protein